jgi:hypothetical protein
MGQVTIEIFEFALLIDHPDGITVIFPQVDHALSIAQGGTVRPVLRGADLELRGPGGAPLADAAVEMTDDYRRLVVDIRAAEKPDVTVPAELLDRTIAPDPSELNGRLFLRGGTITARECSIEKNRSPFNFSQGTFLVTDTAVFTLPIPDQETFQLAVNDQVSLRLADGSVTRIQNADALGGAPRPFALLDEFVRLCGPLGFVPPTPTIAGGPIRPMGGIPVCTISRVSAP